LLIYITWDPIVAFDSAGGVMSFYNPYGCPSVLFE
jgi:hypothetical protein